MKTFVSSLLITTLMNCSIAGALTLTLQPIDLSAADTKQAQKVLNETLTQIPANMREALPINLNVQFIKSAATENRAHLGAAKYSQKQILLNKEFLNPNAQGPFSEKRFRQTLAHEIAHFYDKAVGISDNPQFRAVTGWRTGGNGITQVNNFQRRLPDVYAHAKLTETFPTLFEYFLFDDDFQCRAPELARFFADHFDVKQSAKCDPRMIWYTSVTSGIDNAFREIRREQIWAVDYLWASEGPGFASKFGHAMMRLVICAPHRTPGPDCYKDVQHHLVLSYAAASANGSFANFAGLSGKYPMNLYAIPFATILRQYNTTELRDLYAVPLKTSYAQRDQLIDILYAHHWNLDGDYYFTTQNCATEVDRNLRAIGLVQDEALPTNIPRDLFEKLLSQNYSSYPTRASLTKNPLLHFPSAQKTVDKALSLIAKQNDKKLSNIEDYFRNVNASEIKQLVQTAPSPVLYSLYYLEGIRKDRLHTNLLSEQIKNQSDQKEIMIGALESNAKALFSYRFVGSFLTNKSYGVPSYEEVKRVQSLLTKSFSEGLEELLRSPEAQDAKKIMSSRFSQVLILSQRQTWILREAQRKDLK